VRLFEYLSGVTHNQEGLYLLLAIEILTRVAVSVGRLCTLPHAVCAQSHVYMVVCCL
jgi:hypothetical protein